MRIRGSRAACEEFVSKINSDEPCDICNEQGSNNDMMCETGGFCYGLFGDENWELPNIAADLNIEYEVFSFDSSEPEGIEHLHYKGSKCIVSNCLDFELYVDPDIEPDEIEEVYPELEYYQQSDDDEKVYVLKDEFVLWEFVDGEPRFHFTIKMP